MALTARLSMPHLIQMSSLLLIVTICILVQLHLLQHRFPVATSVSVSFIRSPMEPTAAAEPSMSINGTNDTLTVFLHFHKAGGTSIVRAAETTHTLFKSNDNGMPKDSERNRIPFWSYDTSMISHFTSHCLHDEGATFITAENHWFNNAMTDYLYHDHKIELVTQLRNPFARFLSNYLFAVKFHEIEHSKTMENMTLTERLRVYNQCNASTDCTVTKLFLYPASNAYNMYTRVLSGKLDGNYSVTVQDLDTAKRKLDTFDLVTVMEMPDNAMLWKAKYGMEMGHVNHQKSYNSTFTSESEQDAEFYFKFNQFEREFEELNRMDYLLYQHAKELHCKFAVQFGIFSSFRHSQCTFDI